MAYEIIDGKKVAAEVRKELKQLGEEMKACSAVVYSTSVYWSHFSFSHRIFSHFEFHQFLTMNGSTENLWRVIVLFRGRG